MYVYMYDHSGSVCVYLVVCVCVLNEGDIGVKKFVDSNTILHSTIYYSSSPPSSLILH